MNRQTTLDLLKMGFTQIGNADTDIVRAERRFHDQPIGVYYFDFSQRIADPKFDLPTLRAYVRHYLAPDFYKNEGSLQWNYYFYFVVEKVVLEKMDRVRKRQIEEDTVLARKRICQQEDLNGELGQPLAAVLHVSKPSRDIASHWILELEDAGLNCVVDATAQYDTSVRDLMSGKVRTKKEAAVAPSGPIENGQFISRLTIKDFREYPEEKEFAFGTVNLIRGVNGAGKTSLLEAIELGICGGNRRQNGGTPSGAKLSIAFNGQGIQNYPEQTAAEYRARDLAWYGGYRRTGNDLCYNFGRFNFFNSDAAFELSSAEHSAAIGQALNNLLLGERATVIEERMRQFRDRFKRERTDLQKRIVAARHAANKALAELAQLKGIKDTRDVLLRELKTKADSANWKKTPPRLKVEELAIMRDAVEEESARLDQNLKQLTWLPRISEESIKAEETLLADTLDKLNAQLEAAKSLRDEVEKLRGQITDTNDEIQLLQSLFEYHEQQAIGLVEQPEKIKNCKTRIAALKEAGALLREIDLDRFSDSSVSLKDVIRKQESELLKRRQSATKLKARIATLQKQADTVKNLVEEIKGLGQRYCEVQPDATDCPLCGTRHVNLSEQIEKVQSKVLKSTLQSIVKDEAKEREGFLELQKEVEALNKIKAAAELLIPPKELSTISMNAAVKILNDIDEKIAVEKGSLDEFSRNQKRLALSGFTADGLDELLVRLEEDYSYQRTKLLEKDALEAFLKERRDQNEKLQARLKENEKAHKASETERRSLIKKAMRNVEVPQAETEVDRRLILLRGASDDLRLTKKSLGLEPNEDFATIRGKLDMLAKAIARMQNEVKTIEEKDFLEKRLTEDHATTTAQIANLEPRHKRAKDADDLLNKLLSPEYKARHLQTFIDEQKGKISTIFSRIHAPYEFKKVQINGSLSMIRQNGRVSSVSEISTGQRAALALSIFLSLNSGVTTRAPWLLFDDPIVHVDDLNTLSFFDMLRDLVLMGGRQIFFATADTRIGDLFARKFDVLGGGLFRQCRLQR